MDRKSSDLRSRNISGAVRVIIFFTIIFVMVTTGPSSAQEAIVKVNVPESVSGTFDIFINADNALDLDSGQFDLSFDPNAIQVLDVKDGDIGDFTVPVIFWTIIDPGRIRVIFNFPGVQGVNGTGNLATITAAAIGKPGDTIGLTIHKGLLVNKEANQIPAQWINGKVIIEGIVPKVESAATTRSEKVSGPDTESGGITIPTSIVLGGLAVLALIPILFMIFFRKRQSRN